MSRTFLAYVTAAVFAACSMANAADSKGEFGVKGYGVQSCDSYAAERTKGSPLYTLSRSWLNGYLTAYNQLMAATYDVAGTANVETLSTWLDAYCKQHPKDPYLFAVVAMTAAMEPHKVAEKPEASGTNVGVRPAQISRNTMRRIQQALKQGGYYAGEVDGLFGPGTRAAIRAYQEGNRLSVTGLPDVATLSKMLR